MAKKPYASYFQPGQILFLADGYQNDPDSELIPWANAIGEKHGLKVSSIPTNDSLPPLQFPPPVQNPGVTKAALFSRKPVPERQRFPPAETKPSEFTLFPVQVTGLKEEKEGDADIQLFNFIMELDRNRNSVASQTLRAVSPNWLLSGGSSSPGGTGGPGSRPEAFDGLADTDCYKFDLSHLPPEILREVGGNQGAGVDVAILDTIPLLSKQKIYEEWVQRRGHSLLGKLLDPANPQRFEIIEDGEVNKPSPIYDPNPPGLAQSNDDGHDYEMSDHGLFAAGIIHTLAPGADIHLYEVLNTYGVGDLTAIARGLQRVVQRYDGQKKLVVNMSLTINFPLEDAHITSEDEFGKMLGQLILHKKRPAWVELLCKIYNFIAMIIVRFLPLSLPRCQPSWYERQIWAMEGICDSLKKLDSKVIAAAGNRRKKDAPTRPQAEYPAAFPDVLGVGALPISAPPADPNTRLRTANYSNLSDRPDGTGVATLGGEEGPGKGVLGIYLGKIPGPKDDRTVLPTPSAHGWAWWAGTSFATPIITGITAAVLSNGTLGDTPKKVVENLLRNRSCWTDQNEEVLFVRQYSPSSTPSNNPPPHKDS